MAVSSLLYPGFKPSGAILAGLKDLSKSFGFVVEGGGEEELMGKNSRFPPELLETLKQNTTLKISRIVRDIQEGRFDPRPKNDSLCWYCDFRNICHYRTGH